MANIFRQKELLLSYMLVRTAASLQEGFLVWSLHVLAMHAWVLSGYSGFLTRSKNMHVRLIGNWSLTLEVNVSVHGCSSLLLLCLGLVRNPYGSCPVTQN